MVRVVSSGSGGGGGGGNGNVRQLSSRSSGMEWSLRQMRKIDTSEQHFLRNYYGSDEESVVSETMGEEDQTAYEIFKGHNNERKKEKSNISGNIHHRDSIWAALNVPLRTGVVDGRKVVFELRQNVTQRPEIPRVERLRRKHIIANARKSPLETRLRLAFMHFSVVGISILYFITFIGIITFYAALMYLLDDGHCIGNPDARFADIFDFAVQTSCTIGYGVLSPKGYMGNALVVFLSFASILSNTLFAGLLFTKFVTPVINIEFSDVMTLCNVNGVPCLSFRLGAPDGSLNPTTDINVRLTYSYRIPYTDHKGDKKYFQQSEELHLLASRRHGLEEVWTLRHVVDEASPLFGLNFQEHPGNKIYVFTLSIDAVQDLTKAMVNVQTEYDLEDIMIGHQFENMVELDLDDPKVAVEDFSKMSDTEPYPVWYPAKSGIYAEEQLTFNSMRSFHA